MEAFKKAKRGKKCPGSFQWFSNFWISSHSESAGVGTFFFFTQKVHFLIVVYPQLILNITKHCMHVCSPVPHRNALAGQLAMILHMLSRLTQHWRRIEETCDLWHCANCTQHSRDIFSSNLSIPRRPGLSPSRCTVGRGTKWDHASYHLLQSPRMGTRRHF